MFENQNLFEDGGVTDEYTNNGINDEEVDDGDDETRLVTLLGRDRYVELMCRIEEKLFEEIEVDKAEVDLALEALEEETRFKEYMDNELDYFSRGDAEEMEVEIVCPMCRCLHASFPVTSAKPRLNFLLFRGFVLVLIVVICWIVAGTVFCLLITTASRWEVVQWRC